MFPDYLSVSCDYDLTLDNSVYPHFFSFIQKAFTKHVKYIKLEETFVRTLDGWSTPGLAYEK